MQEIDGANDHGEDLHVTFVQDGRRTADSLAVQVKGGASTRTRRGYRVQVGDHGDNWRDGGLPVLCVVHDPERNGLFWAHATRRLRRAEARGAVCGVAASRPRPGARARPGADAPPRSHPVDRGRHP
ncbi:DUF4365 domain-containing protein [Streptomyces somaliensis]|uniref:DUF4365 domain-containing protein n=1 Tax=Streptomyces somaliensis TaxID=78355 RepID=UPI00355639CF